MSEPFCRKLNTEPCESCRAFAALAGLARFPAAHPVLISLNMATKFQLSIYLKETCCSFVKYVSVKLQQEDERQMSCFILPVKGKQISSLPRAALKPTCSRGFIISFSVH